MSVPARSVPASGARAPRRAAPSPRPTERAGVRPVASTARSSRAAASPTTRIVVRRRAVRRFHVAFWATTAAIVTTIVMALVSVSALVVETGFGIDRTEARIAELREEGEILRRDVAVMSAPGRIAHWAKRKGLEMPETPVVVLQVPGGSEEGAPDATETSGAAGSGG